MTEQTILQKTVEWLDTKIGELKSAITDNKNVPANTIRMGAYEQTRVFITGLVGKKEG